MARQRKAEKDVEWNFFSFPVYFAFALGAFLSVLLYPFGMIVFIISLFGVSFGVAHMISHWYRKRALDKRREHDEEAERERRALAARSANARQAEAASIRRRRRRGT